MQRGHAHHGWGAAPESGHHHQHVFGARQAEAVIRVSKRGISCG